MKRVLPLLLLGCATEPPTTVMPPAQAFALLEQHTTTRDVTSIELTRGRAWVATRGGLAVHARDDGRFLYKLTSADGLAGNSLTVVQAVDATTLLVGSESGAALLRHDPAHPEQRPTVERLKTPRAGQAYEPVVAGIVDGETPLVILHQGGPHVLDMRRGRLRPTSGATMRAAWRAAARTPEGPVLGGMDGRVRAPRRAMDLEAPVIALMHAQDRLYAATGESLRMFHNGRWAPVLDGDGRGIAASALSVHPAGALLVGTAGGHVLKVEPHRVTSLLTPVGGRVSALHADGNRLWLGVTGRGVHLVDGDAPRPLRPVGEICDNHVTYLTRHRGELVVGTFDRGACVLRDGTWHALEPLPSPMVTGLASDGADLYVPTVSGLARFDAAFRPHPFGPDDPRTLLWTANVRGTGAAESAAGQVVLGSIYGLLRLTRDADGQTHVDFTGHAQGAPHHVTALTAVDGEVFVGSETDGVRRMGMGTDAAAWFRDPDPLPDAWVTSVSSAQADTFWAGTCQHGVAVVHPMGHRVITSEDGLPDNRVTAVAAARDGAFVGTLQGVAYVPTRPGPLALLRVEDGLPDPRVAAMATLDGTLWVATEAGLARVKANTL